MIRYALHCASGHRFEAWFRSSAVFDAMRAEGLVVCAQCGTTQVEKAPMAPSVAAPAPEPAAKDGPAAPARGQPDGAERALAALRAHVEANSDYVGPRFASEARAMHEGQAPKRAIHGEARIDEARKLIDDGVPVTPLPFIPRRKMN